MIKIKEYKQSIKSTISNINRFEKALLLKNFHW